jgi:hypothetical protein
MKILADVNSACRTRGLSYVLVGGHAIVARGYARTTLGLDLAVPAAQRDAWRDVFLRLGYTMYHEQAGFMQFTVPDLGGWPVDVMVVDASTFSGLDAESESFRLGGEAVPVASVTHLIFMKLHTMKTGPTDRFAKDLADVLELLRLLKLDPRSPEFHAMCEKYADKEIHGRIVEFWGKRS